MQKVLDVLKDIWAISFVQFIVYLAIAFIAAILCKFLITKLLKALKLDKKLDKWGVNEGAVGTSMSFVGKLVFIVVFLLFLPSALGALGITGVSEPISGFVSTFINYLPRIIAATILVYVGVLVAQILGQIVSVLLKKTKLDNWTKRANEENQTVYLSDIIAKILMAVIILVALVQGFVVLKVDAISAPALAIVNAIFGAIPSILLAVVVVSLGVLVANIACNLLSNVLVGANFDGAIRKFVPTFKPSATKIVVNVVRTIIILFIAAQGIEVLNLAILTKIATAIIAYLPMVIKALVILIAAFVGASLLENWLKKSEAKNADSIARLAKVGIYTLAGFMILSQLGIASTIVNTAFIVIIAAIAVAFALAAGISFGIGGKDFAKKTLDRVDEKLDEKKASDKNENEDK